MKNTFLGLIGSIIMLLVGAILIINLVDYGYALTINNTSNSYFGFSSFIDMLQWISETLNNLGFNPKNMWSTIESTTLKFANQAFFNTFIYLFFIAPYDALRMFVDIILYILTVPSVLILAVLKAVAGNFNHPYNYNEIESMFPLMMSLHQFN